MLSGLHTIIYSADADKDRQFLSDLGLNSVDAGGGWPIYAVTVRFDSTICSRTYRRPVILKSQPSEIAVHPLHGEGQKPGTGLYFMVDDVHAAIEAFKKKKVNCSAIVEHPWGSLTTITLPSGTTVDCYQPKHACVLFLVYIEI
jgi:hypothetical protein